MRLIISLFILLAASTSLSFTVEYPGDYEATAPVRIFDHVTVPLPYGTSTTDNLEVVTWYPVPFWAEPFSSDYDVSVTNAYTYTNVYDQIFDIEQITKNDGWNVGYTILSQRTPEEVIETFILPSNTTHSGNTVFYDKPATPEMVRFNPDPVDRLPNGALTYRKFLGASHAGYTDVLSTNETGVGQYRLSFSGLNADYSMNIGWNETFVWNEVDSDRSTLRYAMSGVVVSNTSAWFAPLGGAPEWGVNLFKETDPTVLNPVNALIAATSNLVDTVVASMTYTNASDYDLFNGAYQTNDAVILQADDYVRWTIPSGVLESNKTYYVYFNPKDHEYNDPDGKGALTVRINGVDLPKTGTEFFQSMGGEHLVDVRIYNGSTDRFRMASLEFRRPDSRRFIYSTENHSTATYIRNTGCWAASLDLTPCSPWNSEWGTLRAGTLVSRDCMINATHYALSIGTTVRFVAADNSVHDRVILDKRNLVFNMAIPEQAALSLFDDITVYRFSDTLPASITACKVWPADYYQYIPTFAGIAGVHLNRAEMVMAATGTLSKETSPINQHVICIGDTLADFQSANALSLDWMSAEDGDSGNPCLEFIGSNPILKFTFTTPQWGPNPADWYDEINQAMTDMGSIYQLDPVDVPALGFSKLGNIGEAP